MDEEALCRMIAGHGFTITKIHLRLIEEGRLFEYRMVSRSRNKAGAQALAQQMLELPNVVEFRISPTGD
jgi:putative Mg2+ transporter-C (MgtC) family protein